MIVLLGETKSMELKNVDIAGFTFNAVTKRLGAAGNFPKVDYSKLLLTISLERGGEPLTIYKSNALAAVLDSTYFGAMYETATCYSSFRANGEETTNYQAVVDLRKVINARNSDVLTLEVTVMDGFFFDNFDVAGCRLEIEEINGIGLEWATPVISTKNITAGEANFRASLGDNVESIMLIDTKKINSFSVADWGVLNYALTSDKVNKQRSMQRAINEAAYFFENHDTIWSRGNGIYIHRGQELDGVNLDITLDPAKVESGRYVLVYRHYVTNRAQVAAAQRRSAKHAARLQEKVNQG